MRSSQKIRTGAATITCVVGIFAGTASAAPTIEETFAFKPLQGGVEFETPEKAEFDKCQVKVERGEGVSGWIVLGPQGQILRRFVDTNKDNLVDQWRYYNRGLEVYRDIDTNYDKKVDQSRWLNTGGSRWGVDEDQDGRIDRWNRISAEEVSHEAVRAMVAGDARALSTLLISAQDVQKLGIAKEFGEKLLASVSEPEAKLKTILANSKVITRDTKWLRFDSATPGLIPADDAKAKDDLMVYENAMAIVESGDKPGLLLVGEIIRVGDTWKLTQIPQPIEGDSAQVTIGGILMEPSLAALGGSPSATGGISPEMQKILEDLQKIDAKPPALSDGPAALARYNADRAEILARLVSMSETEEERDQWRRQMIDGFAAAVQSGGYAEGKDRLAAIEEDLRKNAPNSPALPYVVYRRLLAEYSTRLQTADADARQELQEWWPKQLEDFVTKFPNAEDAPVALFELGRHLELVGNPDLAAKWYERIVKDYANSDSAMTAAGAVRRIGLKGQPLTITGPSLNGRPVGVANYQGKALLVIFWATWCKPCTEDLPQIRALYEQYNDRGFEILGINIDSDPKAIPPYLSEHGVKWQHIHEPGGLETRLAKEFGIISVPTMFLVDQQGVVVSRSVSVEDLKTLVPEMLKK